MDIGAMGGVGGMGSIPGAQRIQRSAAAAYTARAGGADKVDLSGPGRLISKALSLPAIRMDRINEVKQLMESGKFDTEQRLDAALQRFAIENSDIPE